MAKQAKKSAKAKGARKAASKPAKKTATAKAAKKTAARAGTGAAQDTRSMAITDGPMKDVFRDAFLNRPI